MKKGQEYNGIVTKIKFPNKGIVEVTNINESGETVIEKCIVKNVLVGQRVAFVVNKKKNGLCEGRLVSILEKAPEEIEPLCPHFADCGGCTYQNLPYDKQLELKAEQVKELLAPVIGDRFNDIYEGILPSPVQYEYRNKMEFSFGDAVKDGVLELGLHKRGSFYDVISVGKCTIVDEDYRRILSTTLAFFRGAQTPYYHKLTHEGFLRHLLIRKAVKTGELLVDLVTTTQLPPNSPCTEVSLIEDWKEAIVELERKSTLKGTLAGVLHTWNDSSADIVANDKTDVLYGRDYIYEDLLSLRFKISPFSFFQTNSLSAEVLYDKARSYILGCEGADKTVCDLYSGTGTIAQLMAATADKVIGVEIVEEAVEAARENAKLNGLDNCEFIAGDVLKVLDDIEDKPDFIILDPPRDGVNPKALRKIIDYGVNNIVYISCKPTSLARDLEMFIGRGYEPVKVCAIDQFPGTVHVETVVLLSQLRQKPDDYIEVEVDVAELEGTSAETKATYEKIKKYVAEHNDGMKVSDLYIAQVKKKCGIELAENYNLPKSEGAKGPVDNVMMPGSKLAF